MNERKAYPSDLTDEQWQHLRILLPRKRGRGRTRKHNQRDLVNAILYVLRTGCQWRALPHDFPPWQTVYGFFRKLCREGVWETINGILRMGVRQQAGRQADPSVVIIDSQSVKTSEKGAHAATTGASKSKDANDRSRWM
jgi:transposase